MTEMQNNPSTSLLMVEAADVEALPDADPAAGQRRLAVGTDHLLYLVSDAGVKTAVGGAGIANPLATDSLWDAAGDLVQGTGANTAAKLTAGTAGKVLTSNGAAAALTWETPAGGGSVATDALWDAKGDLAGGTGANTAAKLTVGPNGARLVADSAQATGLGWVGPPPVQFLGSQAAATSGAITLVSPSSTSLFFCQITILGNFTISSIVQTNVTWTQLKTFNNGTNARVDLWKGVPTGAPGTLVTVNPSASATFNFVVSEWPTGHGLAGTLDQTADTSGNTAFQRGGVITPTSHYALTFCSFGNASGVIILPPPAGPFHCLNVSATTFASYGYAWGGKHPLGASIPFQTSAQWAATIASVI